MSFKSPLGLILCCLMVGAATREAAAGLPETVWATPWASAVELPVRPEEGFCYISGVAGVGNVEFGGWYAELDVAPTADHDAYASATCYRWSDFPGAVAPTSTAFTGSFFRSDGAWQSHPDRFRESSSLCYLTAVDSLDAPDEVARLYVDYTGTGDTGYSWFGDVVGGVRNGVAGARSPGYGVGCATLGAHLFRLGSYVARPGASQTLFPADQVACLLTRIAGNTDYANSGGYAVLGVNDGTWQLDVGGGVQEAEATCFSLRAPSPCGSLTWEGACWGSSVWWCEDQLPKDIRCRDLHRVCGWDADNAFYNCI